MNPIVELFNDLSDVVRDSDVDPAVVASVLLKLAALGAIYSGMTRSDFLRAADMVFQIESFITEDTKDLPMQ